MKKLILVFILTFLCTYAYAVVPSATPLQNSYTCNGATTQFPYQFPISSTNDIQVYLVNSSGVSTQITSNFSVDTTNVWVNYPISGSPCATGNTLILLPSTPQTQTLALTQRSPFVASAIGSSLDKLTMIDQQLQRQINGAVISPVGTSLSFPSPQNNYLIGWNGSQLANFANTAGSGSVTNIGTISPLTGGPITSTGTIGISQASTSQGGYLSSTDWNTFNSKQPAGSYLTGNQSITLGGILSGSGTTTLNATAGSGYYMPTSSDQTNWNNKQTNLNLVGGTYINGDLCTYSSAGTLLNCNATSANVSSVGLSSPNATLTVGSTPVTTSGVITADINWTDVNTIGAINKGGINWPSIPSYATNNFLSVSASGVNWTPVPASLGLTQGTYTNGDICTYTASGTVLNCNTSPAGSGTVTSVASSSTAKTLIATGGPITGGGTLNFDINWTDINSIAAINMSGINWVDSFNNKTGINWYQVGIVSNNMQTTGVGAGLVQLWNSAKTFFFNQSVNSGQSASYGINWPANAPTSGSVPEVLDAYGDMNWVSVGSLGTWAGLTGNPNAINWQQWGNSLDGSKGVNWSTMAGYTNPITFGGTNWGYIRLYDATGTNWNEIASPATVSGQNIYTMPITISTQNVVTGSRTLGAVYHNTTGKPMFVTASISVTSAADVEAFTDSSSSPSTNVVYINASSQVVGVSFWVLPGNYYEIANGAAIQVWTEWY